MINNLNHAFSQTNSCEVLDCNLTNVEVIGKACDHVQKHMIAP